MIIMIHSWIKKLKTLGIYNVMCRFLFLIIIPVWLLNFVFASIMILPYWLFTGKVFYETKMFKGFTDWLYRISRI